MVSTTPDTFLRPGQRLQGKVPLGSAGAPKYDVVEGREFSPQYRRSLTLQWHHLDVCHIFYDPCQQGIKPERCIFKAANRILYMEGWARAFLDMIHASGCYIVTLSRLDVCCDFNLFANGLHPKEFIRRYFQPPTEETPSYIRHASNKFRVHGQKNLTPEQNAALVDFQTLSFGTRDCAVQTNLYNKSEELKEHDKPYIRALWLAAGLDPADVWRVEFSLNSRGVVVLMKDGDKLQELAIQPLSVESYVRDVFLCYAQQYFSFHEYLSSETRGLRSVPLAVLFERPEVEIVRPKSCNRERCTGRTERVCYRKLRELLRTDEFSPKEQMAWIKVIEYFEQFASVKDTAARMGAANEMFLADFAQGLQHQRDWFPARRGAIPRERIQRLVSLVFASDDADVQAYREAFADFLWHAGVFEPKNYLLQQERIVSSKVANALFWETGEYPNEVSALSQSAPTLAKQVS